MSLDVRTFPGAPDGMGRYVPQHELSDTECYTLFDGILDVPGLIRRRGPLDLTQTNTSNAHLIGLVRTQAPSGQERILKLDRNTASTGTLRGVYNTTVAYSWPYTPADDPDQELFDAKDALGGGVVIGTAPTYDTPTSQAVGIWRGGGKDTTAATTISSAVARGDLTVPLSSGGANFTTGMWIFNALDQLVGCVKSISSDTLTLEHPALVTEAVSVYGTPIRGINPRVSTGRITAATTSAVVNGGLTKFKAQGLNSGTWDIFTPDFTYIGTVTSVASDAQLTLTGNAAVGLLNSDYLAIKRTGSYSLTRAAVGWLNASFGGHQFYADSNKLRFSDPTDLEAVDLTANGDELEFSSDPIRALLPSQGALVTLTENEAYALTGAIGTTPDRWRGERIHDDGTICGMGGVSYKGGVIWPGKRGIWFWDGADPVNIGGKLGNDYQRFVTGVSRCWGMVIQDHYFLFVEDGVTGVFSKTKGDTAAPYTNLTICINLGTGATSLLTNVGNRGWVTLPDTVGLGSTMYGVTLDSDTSAVALGDSLFLDDAVDDDTCLGDVAGPDLYLESKKYDMGDPQRKKLVKMLLLWYRSVAGNLKIDAVPGLETDGTLVTAQFLESATYTDKRSKFMKSTQLFAFRLYQSDTRADGSAALTTRITIGPWAIGFKLKRPGRV